MPESHVKFDFQLPGSTAYLSSFFHSTLKVLHLAWSTNRGPVQARRVAEAIREGIENVYNAYRQ